MDEPSPTSPDAASEPSPGASPEGPQDSAVPGLDSSLAGDSGGYSAWAESAADDRAMSSPPPDPNKARGRRRRRRIPKPEHQRPVSRNEVTSEDYKKGSDYQAEAKSRGLKTLAIVTLVSTIVASWFAYFMNWQSNRNLPPTAPESGESALDRQLSEETLRLSRIGQETTIVTSPNAAAKQRPANDTPAPNR